MADKGGFVPLPNDRPKRGRKSLLRCFGSFYLATLLVLLTACAELLHTCTPHWLFTLGPLAPSTSGSGCFTDRCQVPAASPCLACLFLHALSATKVAIFSFALSWLIFLNKVLALQRPLLTADAASPWLIRGPPWEAFAR